MNISQALSELFGGSKKTDMQDTSIKAYNGIKYDGTLQKQEKQILDHMKRGLDYSLQELSQITGIGINAVSGRCNGLKKKGVLQCAQKRRCSITFKTINPLILK
jgi:DNA-binding CsgD family transcriptional regulator